MVDICMRLVRIYALCDPITKEIRYVGKTIQSLKYRLIYGHLRDVERSNNYRSCWIKSLLKKNLIPEIIELDSIESSNWEWLEQYWISQCKSWGFRLTNLTDGGDGNKNTKWSKETIEKRRLKQLGHFVSKETRDKISKTHKLKNKKLTESEKLKIRQTVIKNQGRRISQYSLAGEFIKDWECIKDASVYYKIDSSTIMRCCKGIFKTAVGFKWQYK